jgi:hypothetical protein
MWQLAFTGYVCCEPGQVALNPTSGYAGICEPADQPIVSSQLATLASQIGGPPITTGLVGGAGSATATGAGPTTTGGTAVTGEKTASGGAASTHTTGFSSSGSSSVLKKVHLSTGEIIGIAVAGVVLIAVLVAGIWCCCCRRSKRRTQVTNVEPYRNQGPPVPYNNAGYNPGMGYNPGYAAYGGPRGVDGEGDSVPLANVGGGVYGQEYKQTPTPVHSELGYDEPVQGVELGANERR